MVNLDVSPNVQAPLDLVMPEIPEMVAEIFAALLIIVGVIYVVRVSLKDRSYYPIMFYLGGALCFLAEPLVDIAMVAVYPHIGGNQTIELVGRSMPLYVFLNYVGSFGLSMVWVGKRIEAGVSSTFIWWACILLGFTTMVWEVVCIHFGLWFYYGAHAWTVLGYPPIIGIISGVAYLLCGVAFAVLKPILTGRKQFLGILVVPIVFEMGTWGTGWPAFSVANTARAFESDLLAYTGLFASILFCIAVTWCICLAVAEPKASNDIVAEGV